MEKHRKKHHSPDVIDPIGIIRFIWKGRWQIIKVTLFFMILGLFIAFTIPEKYRADARLLPEFRDTQGGASQLLRQFSGLGGLSMPFSEGADAIRPDLYPDVLKSTPFYRDLMETNIKVKSKEGLISTDVLTYIEEYTSESFLGKLAKYTVRLPWTLRDLIRGEAGEETTSSQFEEIPKMNKIQYATYLTLRECIFTGINHRTGVISISAEFHDPWVAAQVAQFAVDYLTSYITDYRTEKAQKNFEFVKERHREMEKEFHQAQLALARFRDANRNIVSAAVQTEEQRLQDHYNLAFNVYNNLAQQLEQARIKVQEQTPVIKILEPVQVPLERSKPKRIRLIMMFTFIGGFAGLVYLFLHHEVIKLIEKIK